MFDPEEELENNVKQTFRTFLFICTTMTSTQKRFALLKTFGVRWGGKWSIGIEV